MQTPSDGTQNKVMIVGPDRVTFQGDEVIIEAKHAMDDWEVREFDAVPVYLGEQKYYLIGKSRAAAPYSTRYVLKLWPEGQHTRSKLFHTYDLEAVGAREADVRSGVADEIVRCLLLPFYPFLGFLWSGAQQRLNRFGFVPRYMTGMSIFTVFCLAFGQGIFAVVTINATVRSGSMVVGGMLRALCSTDAIHLGPVAIPLALLDACVSVSCVADVLMRYSHYLRESEWTGGFLEWMVPRRYRKQQPC